jgi:hypothetical protein
VQDERLRVLTIASHLTVLLRQGFSDQRKETNARLLLAETQWRLAEIDAAPTASLPPPAPIARSAPSATPPAGRRPSASIAADNLALASLWPLPGSGLVDKI